MSGLTGRPCPGLRAGGQRGRRAFGAFGAVSAAALSLAFTPVATAQTTPPSIVTAPPARGLPAPTPAPAAPTGAPKSVIPWLDQALTGDPSKIPLPEGAGEAASRAVDSIATAPGAAPTPPAVGAPAAAPGAEPPVSALPGRAPRIDGLPAAPTEARPAPGAGQPLTPRIGAPNGPTTVAAQPDQFPMRNAGPFAGQPETPGLGRPQGNGVGGVGPGAIEVAPMHQLSPSGAGVLSAEDVGLPQDAWSGVLESDAAAMVDDLSPGPFQSVNRLVVRMLSATFAPPRVDGGATASLLGARIDALARFGATGQAVGVAKAAGTTYLPRAGDTALLSGDDGAFCEALIGSPAGEGDALSRIYCQAALGDRYGAIAAIDVTRTLDDAHASELELLEAVADPDLASYVKPPETVAALSPVTLAAMRRLRLDLPPDFARAAPLPLASAALAPETAPRIRLEALERLEQAGAVSPEDLRVEWTNAASAESGGVWGRVEAYRSVLAAPMDRFSGAVQIAMQRAAEAGREGTMARLLAPDVAARAFPSRGEPTPGLDTREIRRLLRLGGEGDAASALMLEAARHSGPEERALDRIASAYPSAHWDPKDAAPLLSSTARGDRVSGRTLAALNAFGVPTMAPDFFQGPTDVSFDLNEGRAAAIALRALDDLSRGGVDVDPEVFYVSLQRLVAVGLTGEARQIATEVELLGR